MATHLVDHMFSLYFDYFVIFNFSKIFISETAGPVEAKFHVKMGRGNEGLYKLPRSHDQDGRHDHIW